VNTIQPNSPRSGDLWLAAPLLVLLALALALRYGTDIHAKGQTVRDEELMITPIRDIVEEGWSVRTAIDFEETKGPAFIWPYAALAPFFGCDFDDMTFTVVKPRASTPSPRDRVRETRVAETTAIHGLRLISITFFVLTGIPLAFLARRFGVQGPALALAALLFALLPYNAVTGQLLMSESSFMLPAVCLMLIFLWGFGDSPKQERRLIGPILFAIVLSILLHNRPHTVALAVATCFIALERDWERSWPWWLACLAAGLSRLPLYERWGGLVSPEYQDVVGLGFRLDSLTYLAAALVPCTAVFLWPALFDRTMRGRRMPVVVGAAIGLVLAIVASPNLAPWRGGEGGWYLGVVASAMQVLRGHEDLQAIAVGVLAVAGVASIGALTALSWRLPAETTDGAAGRFLTWTIFIGWSLYAFTEGFVFDRYLLVWMMLLPILWMRWLPRWLLAAQIIALAAINARIAWSSLMVH